MSEKEALGIVWEYLKLPQTEIKPADIILIFGTYDIRVAHRAAELYHAKIAKQIVVSGGVKHALAKYGFEGEGELTEADALSRKLVTLGVPINAILIENQAQNTGQNVTCSFDLLQDLGIDPQTFVIVQKPYMERRSYATFMKQWTGNIESVQVTSSGGSFDEYIEGFVDLKISKSKEEVIQSMLGKLKRIGDYPAKGFQISQEIPDQVHEALAVLEKAYIAR